MSQPQGEITHVSDTALMVAACRAREFEDPDGFVRDPFAARLAGERGMAILDTMPRPEMMQFGIGIRSRFIDELLLNALSSHPIETVLSLGCGLDARPWRLDLPSTLRWIEADFADMLDYKDSLLSSETPRCRRERITVDLNDPAQRQKLYETVGKSPALMITEGLLMYLPAATDDALAAEVGNETGIAHWIMDVTTSAFGKLINMDTIRSVRNVQASDSLPGEQILAVLNRHGWTTADRWSYIHDMAFAIPRARRLAGERPPGPPPISPEDPTGVHSFRRS